MKTLRASLELDLAEFRLKAELRETGPGVRVLFGPSGSGKSTLLRCLAGLEPRCRGSIELDGVRWLQGRYKLPTHLRSVGLAFQTPCLFPHLDVKDNLAYGLMRRGNRGSGNMASTVDRLDLKDLLDRQVTGLSGGESQRVALGRLLLSNPDLLLLDEPLASLDLERREFLIDVIRSEAARREAPVFHVTHDLEEAAQLGDILIPVSSGQVGPARGLGEWAAELTGPLAQRNDCGVILDARVLRIEADGLRRVYIAGAAGIEQVEGKGPELLIGACRARVNDRIRLRIQARDVSLALADPGACSILNRIPVVLVDMRQSAAGDVLIRLETQGMPLLARVTTRSVKELHLRPGSRLLALVKGVAVLSGWSK